MNVDPLPQDRATGAPLTPPTPLEYKSLPGILDTELTTRGLSEIPTQYRAQATDAAHLLNNVPGIRTPVLFIDQNAIREQHRLFHELLPGVTPFFANKCFSAREVVEILKSCDGHFDAANGHELRRLQEAGVDPSRVIVTKPIHEAIDLITIAAFKPRALVIQSASDLDQLRKVNIPNSEYAPEIIIRVKMPDGRLSGKFGANFFTPTKDEDGKHHYRLVMAEAKKIIDKIRTIESETKLKFGKLGLSTHLGTQNTDPNRLERGLRIFAQITNELKKLGIEVKIFDLGGGFPDKVACEKAQKTQEEIMQQMGGVVQEYQSRFPNVEFIAEPGRYMVANSGFVVSRVRYVDKSLWNVNDRGEAIQEASQTVHIDDGVYSDYLGRWHEGELREIIIDGKKKSALLLKDFQFYPMQIDGQGDGFSNQGVKTTLSGPSCDSMDTLGDPILPPLKPDDLLLTVNMGAYVYNLRLRFNDIPPPQTCFYERNPDGSYTYRLEDPEPIDFTNDEYLRLVQRTGLDTVALSRLIPATTGMFSGSTLSRIINSLAGELEPSLVRPVARHKPDTSELKFPLFDNNKSELQLRDLSAAFEGGMGWVLRCVDCELDRTVALKIAKFPADSNLGERFRSEAQRMASFDHPCIPRVYTSGVLPHNNLPYFIMEYVEGNTFDREIPLLHQDQANKPNWRDSRSDHSKMLGRIRDTAQALEYAHNMGVVHRDIKPQNLMKPSSSRESVKVLDFGLNKAGRDQAEAQEAEADNEAYGLTRVGTVVGTVDYMSPEQACGEGVDRLTDIWALGATLYEVVTNKRPLSYLDKEGQDVKASEQKKISALVNAASSKQHEFIKPPSELNPHIPHELEAIIMKALRVNPSERYQSAAAMAKDIDNFLHERPVHAYQESLSTIGAAFDTATLFTRRESRKVAITATMLLAGGGGLFGYVKYQEGEQAQRIAVAKSHTLGETAQEKLALAQNHAEKGRLNEALATISSELIDQLSQDPTHKELHTLLTRHRQDWLEFRHFQDSRFKVYSDLVRDYDFATIRALDVSALKKFAEIYLPDGLTEESIEALRVTLENSTLTPEQRLQVGDGLIEWAFLDIERRYPETIRYTRSSEEDVSRAWSEVEILQKLANVCEGVDESTLWVTAIEFLRGSIHTVKGNKEAALESDIKGFGSDISRASAHFIAAAQKFREDPNITSVINSGIRGFTSAISVDPDHLASNILLSQVLYQTVLKAENDLDKRHKINAMITTLEDCCRLDPNNPYAYGRLVLALHLISSEEFKFPKSERIAQAATSRTLTVANKYLELAKAHELEIPAEFDTAYGEALFASNNYSEASIFLGRYLSKDPNNTEIHIKKAICDFKLGKEIQKEALLPYLEEIKSRDEEMVTILPWAAAVYSFLAIQEERAGNTESFETYKSEALNLLERGVTLNPPFKLFARIFKDNYYTPLFGDPRFEKLLR